MQVNKQHVTKRKLSFIKWVSCAALFFISTALYAQQPAQQVKGTVLDEAGRPLGSVTVSINESGKNERQITSTDSTGLFSFYALQPGKQYDFIFSFIGYVNYEQKAYTVKAGANNSLLVRMKESNNTKLDDVVIVGYGTQKKVNLTGALSQADGKIFEDKPVGNVAQSLQGVVPNLNITFADGHPGTTGNYNIRGMASITNTGGSPLILIDGIPGNINMINPQDIASISVLKDAASSAIYGARGAFGVILVTTKQGKSGQMKVSYNGSYGFQRQTSSTDFISDGFTMDSIVDAAFSRHSGSSYSGYNEDDYAEMKKRQTDKSLPSVVIQNRNGKDQYVYYGNTDWYHWLFRNNQPSTSHNLTLTGGSEKIKFLISGRYFEQKGMYQSYLNTDIYHAYNFRAKIDATVNKWLSVYTNTQFSANDYTYPGWGYNGNYFNFSVHALASYVPTNPDGTATYITNLNNYQIGNGIFADLQHGKSKGGNTNYDLTNTIGLNITVTKNFVITGNYSYELTPYSNYQRRTLIPYSVYPGVISYLSYDQLNETSNLDQHHTVNLYGTYNEMIQKHHFKLMMGYNQELQRYSVKTGMRQNLLSEDLNQLDLGTGQQQAGGNAGEWALLGFFGRLNYDFDNKYLLEFNGRYDGTSRFPAGNRFGFFPSVSGGWRVSQEPFFQPLKNLVSELKLRASYGSLGNQDVGSGSANLYPYVPVMNTALSSWINNGSQIQTMSSPNPVSPDFTWEKASTVDGGIDVAFLKNRLQLSYDWYTRKTTNMLINGKTLPAVFGASSPKQNAGDLKTNGFDLTVQWHDNLKLAGKPFSYSIGAVLSDYTSRITKFDNPTNLLSNYYIGQQIGEIWGFPIDGFFKTDQEAQSYTVDQSYVNQQIKSSAGEWNKLHAGDLKYLDINHDGIVNQGLNTLTDHGDMKRIGNSLPRYSFGINGSISYSNIDLSFFFQGIGKQNWYPGAESGKFWGPYTRPYTSFIGTDMPAKMWSMENPNAYFPLLRGYEAISGGGELYYANDKYIQNLAYIRLKNLTIGYTFPSALSRRLKLERLHVYFSGVNLFTWTKLKSKYIDPEQVASGSADGSGNAYPFFKTYSMGLDLNF